MHFKHPELLYALFFLIIPLLVHLFQLRKFKKEKFTNVKFLRKASLQTRKSAQLKKWLILCTRILLLTAIIFAFAQPYFPSERGGDGSPGEIVLYLDNSYSMQARGSNGILLRRSIQELLENFPRETSFSLITNDSEFRNVTIENLQKELQQLSYSPVQPNPQVLALKAESLFSNAAGTRDFIAISDFQDRGSSEDIFPQKEINTRAVQLKPQSTLNITVDTVFVSERTLDETTLEMRISASGDPAKEVPVSLYNDENLIARKMLELGEDLSAETSFSIPSSELTRGKVAIDDAGLPFDNQLFFSINKHDPVRVIVINNANDAFLQRIFTTPQFKLRSFPENQVDFNVLTSAGLIVLNEPEEISSPLAGTLRNLLQEDVYLLIIPAAAADLSTYNAFFRENALPLFEKQIDQEKLITNISYSHPLYKGVFDEEVHNFQYPKVQQFFSTRRNGTPVLSYENGQPFLFQKDNSFVFTAALNRENSNFQMAPLIVPTLYNIGNLALESSRLYYTLGTSAKVDINIPVGRDEILKVASSDYSFIPRQQNFQNKVELKFEESPEEPGHYSVVRDSSMLEVLSFNVNRSESRLKYKKIDALEGVTLNNSVSEALQQIESENDIDTLWKWFVIFGVFLIICEIFILKFLK